ncbi:competence protein ComK [Lentibacillus amyloliquefaciens]|uniref:Competence protein n=1 Tax=Lentibacillus amyloliquefaciens TaxID=1472767 RepID=A0A0U4G7K8_9BACI|nr:competence protein ComK [Lentibacillus amyloliquefaciens]ALX48682.1 competence protein [Lentibacillus amyloliquefaciens]
MLNNYYAPSYEITPLTMAVIAIQDENGNTATRILEDREEYSIHYAPSKMVDNACKFFGSSLRGRQDGTRDICGITHKAPISIDPTSGMYFFPTTSPSNTKCSWIAHSHIDQVNQGPGRQTEVIFKNQKSIILSVSLGSMLNQVQRTAQYRYLLDNRIKYLQRHNPDVVAEPFA